MKARATHDVMEAIDGRDERPIERTHPFDLELGNVAAEDVSEDFAKAAN